MKGLRCQCDYCRNAQRMLLDAKQISESLKVDYTSGQIHALRRVDIAWIELLLEREVFGSVEVGFDPEAFKRTCKEKLTAIRAFRKELGL